MTSKSDAAYGKLREAILSATVRPGEHLAEIRFADAFGVGRFAVREALRRLHGEGMVLRRNGRYYVTEPSGEEVRQMVHLRAVLETGALRLLPKKALSRKALAPIRRAARDYEKMVARGYYAGAQEADLRFHAALVAAAGNPRLLRVYEAANLPILQVSLGGTVLEDFKLVVEEHAAIVAALEAGDPEAAASHLEVQLRRGEEAVLRPG